MRQLVAVAILCCSVSPGVVAEDVRPRSAAAPRDLEAALDAFIARGMKDWKIPGLSIVVVKDGVAAYEKGFGVRTLASDGKVDAHTLFGMMSTTKAMTALAVAMLVDEGKVKWDDPVARHLPWFRLADGYLTDHRGTPASSSTGTSTRSACAPAMAVPAGTTSASARASTGR